MHDPAKVQGWGGGSINLWSGYVSHFYGPAQFGPGTFLTGASLLMPRRVCEEIGIFYEGFFMYCDDSDLCLRLRSAGYSLVVSADTAILHKEGGSSARRSPLIDQFATTSMLRLFSRHGPMPPLNMLIYLVLRLLNRVRRAEWANFAAVLRGVRVFLDERDMVFTDRL
jgi:GT2 family glycosyltransferase